MAEKRVQRRLAAILAADVVGYSRLMGADEAGTRARFNGHLRDLIQPTITGHDGRIVKTTGDGLLVEFASVVDAVRCAVTIQEGMVDRNADETVDRRLDFRIGVNLGDVIVEGDDIHGDGVNIAARLEGLANPGGVCISGKVFEEITNKLHLTFEDAGEHEVKNISRPVRVFRFVETAQDRVEGAKAFVKVAQVLERPAVAVLPFTNMSKDADDEYFVDGIVEDLITALSCWRAFPVIARNSTFAYKGKAVDVRQIGQELGARYVLEGSIRRSRGRARITVQLIDAEANQHIWADHFDRDLSDIFAVQDEITERVVTTVQPALSQAEQQRAMRKRPENMGAWDRYQRGLWHAWQLKLPALQEARTLFEQSIELDPASALPHTGLAGVWLGLGAISMNPEALAAAERAAEKAVALDDMDAVAHFLLGACALKQRNYEIAIAEQERALELNPSLVWAHASLGSTLCYGGHPREAVAHIETAIRLSPHDPLNPFWLTDLVASHFLCDQYEPSLRVVEKVLNRKPRWTIALALKAASLSRLGRPAEAREIQDDVRRIKPDFHPDKIQTALALSSEDLARLTGALNAAGWTWD